MIGGIDQQIQQRVDAYRDNPQQLMQRYQQNQELIDLLAMQKLKSEKDAAAREMQMQMQTTPQTIKQQREAELLGRTKDEMVKQTSGIMQERQKRQQQNMQRTANQGLPQLPAGNMQRMAGGGIVAFAEGGGPLMQEDVDAQLKRLIEAALQAGESPEALAERLKDNPNALAILRSIQPQQVDRPRQASMGERSAEAMSIPDRAPSIDTTDIMSILNPSKPTKPVEKVVPPTRLPEKEPSAPAMGERPEEARSLPRPSTRPVSAPVTPGPRIDTTDLASLLGPKKTKPYQPLEEAAAKRPPVGPDRFGGVGLYGGERAPTAEGKGDGAGGFGGILEILRQMQESAAQTPGGPVTEGATLNRELRGLEGPGGLYEGQAAPQTEVNRPDSMTVPQIDPRQQQMDQLQEIDTSGLAGLKKASLTPRELYEANRSVLSKELLRQQNPEELARQRQIAFKLGALSRGGRGGLAGAAAASERAREVQAAQKLQGIGSLMGVDEKLMTMDQEAQKMELEKESNRLLSEIRQGQLTAAQMNSIAGEISSMTEQVESALMMDTTYDTLNRQYQEAVEKGDAGRAETLKRQLLQYRQSKIESMYPNYADLVKTQKELNQKMSGSTGFGKVERLPQ
jgi:hypothetical protein